MSDQIRPAVQEKPPTPFLVQVVDRVLEAGGGDYDRKMKFDITWREGRETKKIVVEAETGDDAVRRLAAERGHAPGMTYEVEPEDDLGYLERITLDTR